MFCYWLSSTCQFYPNLEPIHKCPVSEEKSDVNAFYIPNADRQINLNVNVPGSGNVFRHLFS